MDKAKKQNLKRIIALVCAVVLVALLAAMPLIAKQEQAEDGPTASILSGTVSTGSIDTKLIGGGTLTEEEAVTISIPAAVKLKEFLVSNGDTVSEGAAVATADRVTVMRAISQVQETLEYLSQQIENANQVSTTEQLNALAGGTVKIIYAQKGDSVHQVMLEHGALAVLSLDGLMAVDFETESTLAAATTVTVTLSDGTEVPGKIAQNLAGEMTVTLEDRSYAVGETVQVTAADGTLIGSGDLYIYSPWNATAYAGTVDSIKVKEGDKLSAGKPLMVLRDVGYSATYRQLVGQRQEYEELMLDLFNMYQTETVTAPCDGVVSGIDKDSAQLLSASDQNFVLSFLSNAPNGDDETTYANYVGQVTGISDAGWNLNINPQAFFVADYQDLSGVSLDPAAMTQPFLHTMTDIPLYTLAGENWVQVNSSEITVGDILLFAENDSGVLVWGVLLQKATQPDLPDQPTQPDDPSQPADPTIPGNPTLPGNPGFTYPSGGNWGGIGGAMTQEPAFELYGLDMAEIAAVTPQDTMTLEISIDELDIHALQVGMTAQVKIDALGGEKYTATITAIGNTGTSNGGSSKYTAELTMERAERMLSGMNATAAIVLSTAKEVLTLPAEALVEQGNQTVVYTGYDEETQALLNPVIVTVGNTDGKNVEILDGLALGQTYYYAYYDTLEISVTPDFGGFGFR